MIVGEVRDDSGGGGEASNFEEAIATSAMTNSHPTLCLSR